MVAERHEVKPGSPIAIGSPVARIESSGKLWTLLCSRAGGTRRPNAEDRAVCRWSPDAGERARKATRGPIGQSRLTSLCSLIGKGSCKGRGFQRRTQICSDE